MNTTKGRAVKEDYGLCKLLVAPDHKILGCHIVGYQASVLLHAVLPIMKWRNDIHSLVDIIYILPHLPKSFVAQRGKPLACYQPAAET